MWKAIDQRLKSSFLLRKRVGRTAGGRRYGCWYVITLCLPERRKRSVWWSEADSAGWSFSWHPIWRGLWKITRSNSELSSRVFCIVRWPDQHTLCSLNEWHITLKELHATYMKNILGILTLCRPQRVFFYTMISNLWKSTAFESSHTLHFNAYMNCDM